ncbi:hypothetical protein A3C09_00145 [Candidatus Uhrbacteria bacterium RIFCSPHIGHO2_02_FULL_47_44]|uniref:Uncharacterized protein n=1 Tax=Candidatus Uhrbacteria bacterium RIFCSPLOWO2_02_FULL_48_18 TaxID=1802408 RepID=A0A1F7V9C4_9BACT|nr:MAG: hypothetical protein A2839_01820 [Candidatus Uhrbacteria bacterium RIFCSPHIGHO2_01_FULL_47_10]OGL71626.1 MAG: hypothetical protein A3C09_00145 [Candidatus Uhrbacteria bacterium RIFCSPHIGHO2_02_FULL_47_44]OGL76595.1 MAG: hypothetical protein A3E97_04700 [Candidatus Uhrbacteria bacterium RIFCSPHIGHO2_12_FULL_47_12]OGL80793.1 MAG: hypothetical protein A3B20_05435 [Candidatus Uhrbacteria bacterium RIFCSPLOWO2_01_FULL_47_17]OGL86554.1 MAG: hypothetical protein A3I41_04670 [Candidatus Uhrbact
MKHPSFFSFIILALTLILVTGFVFSSAPKKTTVQTESSAVSEKQYQTALAVVLQKFVTSYDATTDDSVRAQVTDQTLGTLLSMRVPAAHKDFHLSLAITLQKIKQGFVSNPQDVLEAYTQMKAFISQTSWLNI